MLLDGNNAFIEDSTKLGSNSALTGLASIGAGASFELFSGASVSTTGALRQQRPVNLDGVGSSLTVGGTLTNSGGMDMDIGNRAALSTTGGLVNDTNVYLDLLSTAADRP